MSSLRNTRASEGRILDAARDSVLAVGWRRTTLTEVARRAQVSRMTMYRRWPDMQALMADLMTREWSTLGARSPLPLHGESPTPLRVAHALVEAGEALRENPLFRKVVEVDPELLLTYLIDRRGRTQDALLEAIEPAITRSQSVGVMRQGDAKAMARSIVLAVHGFVVSASTMTDGVSTAVLADELRLMLERYLQP